MAKEHNFITYPALCCAFTPLVKEKKQLEKICHTFSVVFYFVYRLDFFPKEILVTFLEESQLQQSCAMQRTN